MSSGKARNGVSGARSVGGWKAARLFGIGGLAFVAVWVAAGCSGESELPEAVPTAGLAPAAASTSVTVSPTAEPTAAVVASAAVAATKTPAATATITPSTVPTAASTATTPPAEPAAAPAAAQSTPLPLLSPLPPVSEVTYEQQKELLSTLVKEWYAGENNIGMPRLNLLPDVRDNRRGGILIHIEINGDEYDSTTKKKAELDKLMRDTYEVIYGTGYDVTEVAITAIMNGTIRKVVGGTAEGRIQVFRSRLRGDVAATVDWANKESLDFNEIWETVLLNVVWKRELAAEAEGGE